MQNNLIKLPFKHSTGAPIGIDMFMLDDLYRRQKKLDHSISEPHRIGFYMLIYFLEGHGSHIVDFQQFQAEPDTLAIISKHQIQQFDPALILKGHIVLITEEFLHRALFDLEGGLSRMLFEPVTTQAYFLKNAHTILPHVVRLKEEYSTGRDEHGHAAILTRELGILLLKADRLRRLQLSAAHEQAETSPRLVAFRDLLDEHFRSHWTVQMYADELGFSKRTLGSLTQKHLNRSPKQVIDQRLNLEIKRLLAHTDLSIKEIAYQLGFEDPSNLNKFFQRMKDETPSAFRRRIHS